MTTIQLETGPSNWTLRDERLACTIALANGMLTWRMDGPGGLATLPAELGRLVVDGHAVSWAQCTRVGADDSRGNSRTLTLDLEDAQGMLQLSQHIQFFPDQPFVRFWSELTNGGQAPVRVDECTFLTLAIPVAPLYMFHVDQFSWSYRRDFFTQHQAQIWPGRTPLEVRMGSFPSHHSGPSSCGWVALRDAPPDRDDAPPQTGPGLVAGIEFNGKSRLYAWADATTTRLESQIDNLAHILAPGAAFAIPAFFVGQFNGDWDQAGYATQRFAETHIHPPMPDERYPWVQYNSWRYEQNINEAQQLAAIERCGELGVEVAVMDLGWARGIGDWRVNPEKFPRGLAPLAERARSLGIRLGIHMAFAQCNPAAPIAQAHPDWLIHTGDDYFGAAPLCLGHQPCRDWVIGAILRLIDEEGIDYIIQDGEDMVKRCPHAHHTHAPGDSNYAGSQLGLDVVIETIRRTRPQVVWENCEDGGCMLTYKMARLYHTSITVDNIATYATRQGIYGASYPFSPRYSVRYMQDDPTPYTLRSAIFGGPLILMQRITEWDAQQLAETKAAIEQYKQLRVLVRDAKIIHLRPPRHNLGGIGWGWDAIQAVAADQSRSVVMIYRAQGDTPQYTLRPRGLAAGATYQVRLVARGTTIRLPAEALERDGIELSLGEFDSEIMWIEREGL
jgi:alpha-galactosidase